MGNFSFSEDKVILLLFEWVYFWGVGERDAKTAKNKVFSSLFFFFNSLAFRLELQENTLNQASNTSDGYLLLYSNRLHFSD